MRKLFLTIFLWFWLPLLAVAVLLMGIVGHAGPRYRFLVRLGLHDLMLFSVTGGIFCYLISRYLTKPLAKLGDAAANIAEGRLDTRVDNILDTLKSGGFDAAFLAVGAHVAKRTDIPARDANVANDLALRWWTHD